MPRLQLVLSACLLVGGPATTVAAEWSAPAPVSAPGPAFPAGPPVLSVASDGTAVVAWQRSAGSHHWVEAAQRYGPSLPFEVPVVVDEGTVSFTGPAVAAARGSRALVGWARRDTAPGQDTPRVLGLGLTDAPSSPQEFAPAPSGVVVRTALGAGVQSVLWAGGGGGQVSIARRAGGAWSAPLSLADTAGGAALAVADSGAQLTALVTGGRVLVARDGGVARDLGAATAGPALAVRHDGGGAVAWCTDHLWLSVTDGTNWSAPEDVDTLALAVTGAPALATNARGEAVVAWRTRTAAGPLGVAAAVRRRDGSWTAPRLIAAARRNLGAPTVVIGARGTALVAWAQPTGPSTTVLATRTLAGGVWGARRTLPSGRTNAVSPTAATDAAGRVTLSWLTVPRGPYRLGLRVMTSRRLTPLR